MARDEGVVDTLPGLWEAGESVQLPEGGKKLLPASERLVDVALVAYVEDQAVPLRVEAAVDGHGELHGPQVGGQVPAGPGHILQQELPQLPAELRQPVCRQGLHVPRGMDIFQNHRRIPHFHFWPPGSGALRGKAHSAPSAGGCQAQGSPRRHRFV